jgi:hypothetical protein
MKEIFDHQRLPRYEDMSPEEQRQIDNDMDEEMFLQSAQRRIDNGGALAIYRIWRDDIAPLLPKAMRDAA